MVGTSRQWIGRAGLRGSLCAALGLSSLLAAGACKKDGESAAPTSDEGRPRTTASAPAGDDDMRRVAAALIDAYNALAGGDLDGAADSFASEVVWHIKSADERDVDGREGLRAYWKSLGSTSSRDVGLQRVFIAADDLVISQGVIVDRSRGKPRNSGFVTIGRVEDGQIAEVTEFVAPGEGEGDEAVPSNTEVVDEVGDDVNKAMAETLHVAWSRRDWGAIEGMFGPNFVHHDVASGSTDRGFDAYKEAFEAQTTGFPDMSFEIVDSWAAGEYVIVENRVQGTHTGKRGDLAPTKRSIDTQGVDIYRFADGLIVEMWSYRDPAAITDQLQAPPPKAETDDDE
ncbi:MAG: nuclear transport factor 2 family protein [Myxococcales bacterium]|nr:nuclear transport factor 2 family protein [Myxococcales bacterium]